MDNNTNKPTYEEMEARENFEAWVITQVFISKPTLEGLRTEDGYRNSTISGTDYHRMWLSWKAAAEQLEAQVKQLAAESEERRQFILNGVEMNYISLPVFDDDPANAVYQRCVDGGGATDAFLSRLRAEMRAEEIPDGYVLVPQEMCFSAESMEGICFHCGDGGHMFGDFTDGVLYVGEVDYGDGKKIHGLHIATADCPEEGCATICEFLPALREGKAGEVCSG